MNSGKILMQFSFQFLRKSPSTTRSNLHVRYIFALIFFLKAKPNSFPTVLKKIFDTFDVDKEGAVPLTVIPTTLSTLGVKIKEEEMNALIKEIDDNGSGRIEFKEYINLAKRYIEPEDDYNKLHAELREVFMIFDKESEWTGLYQIISP